MSVKSEYEASVPLSDCKVIESFKMARGVITWEDGEMNIALCASAPGPLTQGVCRRPRPLDTHATSRTIV